MRVSLQLVRTAEIREGLIRSSDDFPILYCYIHCTVEVTAKRQEHP